MRYLMRGKTKTLRNLQRLFLRCIQKTSGCWLWTGKIKPNGYGYFYLNQSVQLAHRAALILLRGINPKGSVVRHRCDTPACVRPSHLIVGTQLENIADCVARGRKTPPPILCKVTDDQAAQIRGSSEPSKVLVARYNLSREQIRRIRNGTSRTLEMLGKKEAA